MIHMYFGLIMVSWGVLEHPKHPLNTKYAPSEITCWTCNVYLIHTVKCTQASPDDYHSVMQKSQEAWKIWRDISAPKRGEVIRQLSLVLREKADLLGKLVRHIPLDYIKILNSDVVDIS